MNPNTANTAFSRYRRIMANAAGALALCMIAGCSNSKTGGGIGARSTQAPAFQARVEIDAVSQGLTSAIAHDWTGDGLVDILVSGSISQEVRLLVASSRGVFQNQAGPVLRFQEIPFDLVRFDLEGDGDADFAVVFRRDARARVFRNDGSGRFSQFGSDLSSSGLATGLVAGDFDRDGKIEFAISGETRIDIYENGATGFVRRQFIEIGRGAAIGSLDAAKMDADSFDDLLVSDTARNEVRIYAGGRSGFATNSSLVLQLPGQEPTSVVGGDATGDGVADVVVALYGSRRLAVFPGNGAGNFNPATTIELGDAPFDVALGTLPGFGQPQLVVSYLDRAAVSVVEARGGGAFGPERQYGCAGLPTMAQVVDVDGDGGLDVLATSVAGSRLSLLRGEPRGLRASEDFSLGAGGRPEFVLAADFNGDGVDDALVSDPQAGKCHVLLGQRNSPSVRLRRVLSFDAGSFPTLLVRGDFDRDGRVDAAVSTRDGMRLLLNRMSTTPSFQVWPGLNGAAIPVGKGPLFELCVGRFDADEIDDVAVADRGGNQISVLYGAANGIGFRPERALLPVPGGPLSPIAADFDGDGNTDIATSAFDAGYLRVYRGDGEGRFEVMLDERTQPGVNYLRYADLDSDGRHEIVASGVSLREILVLDIGSNRVDRELYAVGVGPTALLVQDVNNDARADLVVSNWTSGDVSVLLGDGLGGFQATPALPGVFRAVSMGAGDFDGDGLLDLLIASQFTDRVTLLRSLR